ncbi:MAG: alcohol dehydrogenase catalytic domain-containing protein [Phycisphaerae bacterium]|nr:alcohol dehydrogenase catalytic domain-containing protein [Phycisphaerae bacterium]
MKAAYLVGPERFELRDVPQPPLPEDGLLLTVQACGICGSDLRRWKEGPPAGSDGVVPGHEAAGTVLAVGARCGHFAVGDRLAIAPDIRCGACYYCNRQLYNLCDHIKFVGITPGYPGGFAQIIALTAEILNNGIVNRMPDRLSFEIAAISEPFCSVLATHEKAQTKAGDTVVIMGAGPVGCLHVALAKQRGAKTIVCEPAEMRRRMALDFGPDLVVDPTASDPVVAVKDATGGVGADIVVCANPVAETQTQAVEMVRKAGKVLLFGGLPKANPMTTLDGNRIHYGEIEVIGAFSYHPATHKTALELLAGGAWPADKLITHTLALEQIEQGYRTASGGRALKVMITMQEN